MEFEWLSRYSCQSNVPILSTVEGSRLTPPIRRTLPVAPLLRFGARLLGDFGFVARALFESRVFLQLFKHHFFQFDARKLQQLDRLLKLRRHHQLSGRAFELGRISECHN